MFFVIHMFRFLMLDARTPTELNSPSSLWADVEPEQFIGCLDTKLLTLTEDYTPINLDPGACGVHLQHL